MLQYPEISSLPSDAARDPSERAASELVRKIATEPSRPPTKTSRRSPQPASTEEIVEIAAVAAIAGFTTTDASAVHLKDGLEAFDMGWCF